MANLEYFSDEDVISFTLLDARTVERLQREGDIKLPRKKVDIPKDERWNTKQMSSKLLQGILAGDAIPTIANSLMQVIGNNAAAAVRNARTMVTGAENVGRLDSYEDLAEKGVVQKKVWIATADDRTRESHLLLDGEEVDIDKPFSNGLMYPADPSGDPAEVYNCRCSMRDHIVGFRRADGSISYVGAERDTTSHAGKIENEIERRGIEPAVAEVEDGFKLVGGKHDAEITDSIYDYHLPQATRDKLDEISEMSTYNEFKDYFAEQGIELDTGLEKLKGERADDDIPAVKELLQKITVGIDSYKETFGEDSLSALKKIVLYDENLDTHAAYFFNLIGENDPDAGTIKFSDWNATGRDVFHELGHAFQDSMKADDEDIISFANRLAEEIDIPNSAYKGTSDLGEENAEMMAEALGFGFSQGIEKDIDFIEELRELDLTPAEVPAVNAGPEAERAHRGIEEEIPASTVIQREEKTEGDGTYGEDQLGHKYTREEYEERLETLNEYEKYHYHATTFNAIRGIKEEGLKPSIGHAGEEVYMAKTKNSALEWTSSTSTGGTVVIRVANTFLAQTDYIDYDHNIKGEGSTSATIPLSQLEILTSDGKWIPLKDAVVSYMRGVPTIIRKPR